MAREGVGETRPRDRASDGRPIRSPEVRTERRRERRADGPHVHLPGGCVTRLRDPLPTDVSDLPPLPAGYDDIVDEGLASLGPDARRADPGGHRRPRPAPPGLDGRDQPDRDPRACRRRPRARPRQPDGAAPAPVAEHARTSSISARAGASRGSRWRSPCRGRGPCSSNRSARRRRSWPRSSTPSSSGHGSPSPRRGPRPWRPIRTIAAAGPRSSSARSDRWPSSPS